MLVKKEMGMRNEIVVFHGTRASPDSIRKHGLLAGGLDRTCGDPMDEMFVVNKERTLARVLAELGLKTEQVPEWTYRGELEYEKNIPIHIHFEPNFWHAVGYADMGGEPAYCMRRDIMSWLKASELGDPETALRHLDRKLADEVDEEARKKNGEHGYVIAVKLSMGDPRIEQDAVDLIRRVDGLIEEGKIPPDYWSEAVYEVRYFGDVPPERIVGIVRVI